MNLILLPVDLALFDGAASGMGGTNGGSVSTQQSDSGGNNGSSVAGKDNTSDDRESKRKAYMELINGDYKDIHTEEMQKIINRRFKETKSYEEQIAQYREITDLMDAHYGTKDHQSRLAAFRGDGLWEVAADEAGKTRSEYMSGMDKTIEYNRLKAKEQAQKWDSDVAAVSAKYPDFDINAELQNPKFAAALRGGLSMEDAYRNVHYDELMRNAVSSARAASEKAVADNIRAKGQRPAEAGTASTSGFTGGVDFKRMTAEQRAKIAEATKAGKPIDWRNML